MQPIVFAVLVTACAWTAFNAVRRGTSNRIGWAMASAMTGAGLVLLALGNAFVAVDGSGVLREFGVALPSGAILVLLGAGTAFVLAVMSAYRRFAAR